MKGRKGSNLFILRVVKWWLSDVISLRGYSYLLSASKERSLSAGRAQESPEVSCSGLPGILRQGVVRETLHFTCDLENKWMNKQI